MRVVDEDRRTVALADPLEPALGAFEMFERGEYLIRLAAGADREARGDNRVLDLEFADQRQADEMNSSAMLELKLLREAVDSGGDNTNALACAIAAAADRDQIAGSSPRAASITSCEQS